jgi:hypothetical protein
MPSIGQCSGKSARVTWYWFAAFGSTSLSLPDDSAVCGFGTVSPAVYLLTTNHYTESGTGQAATPSCPVR